MSPYYRNGRSEIIKEALKQQPQTKAKIAHNVKLLRQHGNKLGMPHSKSLGLGLYELRIKSSTERSRSVNFLI